MTDNKSTAQSQDPFAAFCRELEANPIQRPDWQHPEWEPLWHLDEPANENARQPQPRQVHVTIFPNEKAQKKSELTLTLAELGELIRKASARSKGGLPWLKLAKFGDQRTEKNCLRSNDNVEAISGIELDYEAGG